MSSRARKTVTTTTVTPVPAVSALVAKVTKQRRRRQRGTSLKSTNNARSTLVKQYVGTLNDPFDIAPPRLGYSTFLDTQMATAYLHNVTDTNADGSISFVMSPSVNNIVGINNNGLGSAVWSYQNAANSTAIQSDSFSVRIVSGGIRVCPLVAATSTPGVIYAAAVSSSSPGNFTSTATSNSISLMPSAHMGLATYGATVLLRPQSDHCIEPFNVVSNLPSENGVLDWYFPIITLQLPAGVTKVAWEAVLNIELIPSGTSAGSDGSYNPTLDHGLSTYFPSFSGLFNAVAPSLIHPVHLDFNEGGPSTTNFATRTGSRSTFNSINIRRAKAMFAGSYAQNMTLLGQEIKSNQVRANVRVQGDPSETESYIDLGGRVIRETIVPSVVGLATAGITGLTARELRRVQAMGA